MNKLYKTLEDHVTSTVYEGMLKLGFGTDENFDIYYDLDLLNHLLSTSFMSNIQCMDYLFHAKENLHTISDLSIVLEKGRFRFTVKKENIHQIYELYRNHTYLEELINLMKTHHATLSDVINIFEASNYDFVLEKSTHEEFHYVIYLSNSSIDPYRYCFSFDEIGSYYHRLLPYSYNQL